MLLDGTPSRKHDPDGIGVVRRPVSFDLEPNLQFPPPMRCCDLKEPRRLNCCPIGECSRRCAREVDKAAFGRC